MGETINKALLERQRIEEAFHDSKYRTSKRRHDRKQRRQISRAYSCYRGLRGDVEGLNILDFGCGDGWTSIELAKEGARVWGIDISEESVRQSRQWALEACVEDKMEFAKMPGEKLSFSDQSFDLVLGSAILHHTDIALSIKEIHRVLKEAGKGVFIEPMNQNVLLKAWRRLTPSRRSPTEKALTRKDIRLIMKVFPKTRLHFFGLLSIITSGLLILFGRRTTVHRTHVLLGRIDDKLLKLFPLLGEYCSVVVLELYR